MVALPQRSGSTVLVIEADRVQALDLERSLNDLGCAVLGPVGSRADVLDVLRRERPDLAVLGAVRRHGISVPLAQQLVSADVPFALFASNDDGVLGHQSLRAAPLLPKPYVLPQLRGLVHRFVRISLLASQRETDRLVEQALRSIKFQACIISRLAHAGHDTKLAEELMVTYERTLAILQERRVRFAGQLSRQQPHAVLGDPSLVLRH